MTNYSNETEYAALTAKSLATLYRTRYASIGMACTGSLAFLTNTIVLAAIIRAKNLHNRCFFLLGQLAIADWLVGVSFLVAGMKRSVRLHYRIAEVHSQLHCIAEMIPNYFRLNYSRRFASIDCVPLVIYTCVRIQPVRVFVTGSDDWFGTPLRHSISSQI